MSVYGRNSILNSSASSLYIYRADDNVIRGDFKWEILIYTFTTLNEKLPKVTAFSFKAYLSTLFASPV